MQKNKATEAAQIPNQTPKDNSSSVQRTTLIHALRTGAKTTPELRESWGILSPAPRVFELRMLGYEIETLFISAFTAGGEKHHGVAKYVLRGEPVMGGPLGGGT